MPQFRAVLTFTLCFSLSSLGRAQVPGPADVWVRIGPFGAHVYTLLPAPDDPGRIWAGTTGGLFRSDDGLATWHPVPITGGLEPLVRALWIDPLDPQTMVAATDYYLYRSTDAGESWARSEVELPTEIAETPNCLVGDPDRPHTVYACSGPSYLVFSFGQGVLVSTDGGASFHLASPQLATAHTTDLLAVPGEPFLLYAAVPQTRVERERASPTGVLVSADRGATWVARNAGLVLPSGKPGIAQLARDPTSGRLFALEATTGAVFSSDDGAASWSALPLPVPAEAIGVAGDGALYLGSTFATGQRLFRSADGGATWEETAAPQPAALLEPQPPLGGVYATARHGLVVSHDGGTTWEFSRSGLGDRPGIPLGVAGDGAVHALWGERSYRRRNGAWRELGGYLVSLAIDPRNPAHQLAIRGVGLERSRDGGRTWRPVDLPDACVEMTTVAFAPSNPRVVYAGGFPPEGSGPGHHPDPDESCLRQCQAFRSGDGGATWSCLPLDAVRAFVVDPQRAGTAYALSAYSSQFPGLRWLAKTTDGGRTWRDPSAGLQGVGGYLLAIDGARPRRLFTFVDLPPGQQLFASEDGGASWGPVGEPLPPASHFALSLLVVRSRPDVFYVGTIGAGILRSGDGGKTWRRLANGLPAESFYGTLIADPTRPGVYYAGTTQRGVAAIRRNRP